MNNKILLTTILNQDFETFSELLDNELSPEQYNYTMNNQEMDDEISSKGMDTWLNYRSTLFSLLAHMKYVENDPRYYDRLIAHHKQFDNINVYTLWHDQNLLFSNTFHPFIEDFIALGMNSKLKDSHGETPVMYAARSGLHELLHSLIKSGADTKSRDKNGAGLLMFTAKNNEKSLEVLLQYDHIISFKELKKIKDKNYYDPEIKKLVEEKFQIKTEKNKFEFLLSNKKEESNKIKRKI